MTTRPILLLTRIWPTPERPSLGTFVRDRASGVEGLVVVKPRRRLRGPLVYGGLLLDAIGIGGRIRGVEAHMAVPTGLVGLIVARLRGVPLVIYSHGGDVRGWRTRAAPIRWLLRTVVRRADRILANSENTAAELRRLGADPVVVPPGVDLERFGPSPRPAERRVLYLGGRPAHKGYDDAVAVADTLAGPGLRDVDPSEIPDIIAAHDVLVVPSHAEAFGLVAVEAIASGRWVVAREVGGLRDIVIDGVNGTLVADGDFRAALAKVPDYDPWTVAGTVEAFSRERWQQAMARTWEELGAPDD